MKMEKKRRFSEEKRRIVPNLPEDIVFEILCRLPVRSLGRFMLVSRCWRSIISNPSFAISQFQMCSDSSSSSSSRVFIARFPLRSIVYNQRDVTIIRRHHLQEIDPKYSLRIMGSHNGLLCFHVGEFSIILHNPTTQRSRSIYLPDSKLYLNSWRGFGFDSISKQYKVVSQVCYMDSPQFHLFSITDSDEATAPRIITCDMMVDEHELGKFVNGSLHWLVRIGWTDNKKILRLDLGRELVGEYFSTPYVQGRRNMYNYMSTIQGRLSLTSEEAGGSLGIWVMNDYGVSTSWTEIMRIPLQAVHSTYLMPLAFRGEAEILCHVSRTRLLIFNSEDKLAPVEDVYNGNYNEEDDFDATVYMESLISP